MSSIPDNPNRDDRRSIFTFQPENILADKEEENGFLSFYQKYGIRAYRLIESHKKMDMIYNYMIKNEISPAKDPDQKEEKVRKTRKDKEGRKFICGQCKLGYLSYPALYTHIKTKHHGETPAGTIRGESGKPKKRGRPKVRKTPQIYQRELEKNQFPKDLMGLIPKDSLDIMDYQFDKPQQDADDIDLTMKYFVGLIRQIKKSRNPILKLFPINKIITTFLFNLKEYIDASTLISFQQTFYDLIIFINRDYFKILTEYQLISKYYVNRFLQQSEIYCNVENAQFVPVFIERFIKDQLDSDDQMNQQILFDFCKWLHSKKLTDILILKDPANLSADENNQ